MWGGGGIARIECVLGGIIGFGCDCVLGGGGGGITRIGFGCVGGG